MPIRTSPTVASVTSTPVASGLIPPVPRKAGPRPMKIRRPCPATTVAVWPPGRVTVLQVRLPSRVTKSPISIVSPETEISQVR